MTVRAMKCLHREADRGIQARCRVAGTVDGPDLLRENVGPGGRTPGPEPNISRLVGESGQTVASLVEQLRQHPAEPSTAAGRVGLYLIGADGGEATLIASEPDPWLNQCGSPVWSPDGKRILFEPRPGSPTSACRGSSRSSSKRGTSRSRTWTGELPGRLALGRPRDLPAQSRARYRARESSVWLMNSDGTGRRTRRIRPAPLVPDGHQFLVIDFSSPCQVTVIDDRPGEPEREPRIPGERIYPAPSWAASRRSSP